MKTTIASMSLAMLVWRKRKRSSHVDKLSQHKLVGGTGHWFWQALNFGVTTTLDKQILAVVRTSRWRCKRGPQSAETQHVKKRRPKRIHQTSKTTQKCKDQHGLHFFSVVFSFRIPVLNCAFLNRRRADATLARQLSPPPSPRTVKFQTNYKHALLHCCIWSVEIT